MGSPLFTDIKERIARHVGVGPVRIGIVVTAVTTGVLFVIPFAAPMGPMRRTVFDATGDWWMGNPLKNLRLLGGVLGGFVAGYLTRWSEKRSAIAGIQGAVNGVKAALLGLTALYLLYVTAHMAYVSLVLGQFPPPVYLIVIVPLVFALPLAAMYLFGGLVGGLAGNLVSALVDA